MATQEHGGNLDRLARESGRSAGDILDFSANINPLGPPEWLRPLISRQVSRLIHYPDPDAGALKAAIATRYQVETNQVLVGNGSTELLYLLAHTVGTSRAIIPVPSYADYARAAHLAGLEPINIPLRPEDGFQLDTVRLDAMLRDPATVFLGRPNNPTGQVMSAEALRSIARAHPHSGFVVDEAFGDFVDGFDSLVVRRPRNVAVLLSLTKIFAVPGLRLGCAIADADRVRRVEALQPPWSVNTLAQAVGVAALQDVEYVRRTRERVGEERVRLQADLQGVGGLVVHPGAANFLLLRLDVSDWPASRLAERLLKDHGIAIRVCDNFKGLDDHYFRVAVRTREENERLVDALQDCLATAWPVECEATRPPRRARRVRSHTPAIMFQGTGSNAGKSVMTAALCRILLQDGVRVAPFKAQNMSLNSFVTLDGGEMGRAQVVQAQACRIEPDVRMNPVLLKPNSATGSQVIVLGKPIGNRSVDDYIRYKAEAYGIVCRAYDELAAEYDVMVLEGAGSPGEVNLKAHDIVNMAMARHARSPVLLVGDIDRGGVFAAFVGTLEVLSEWERALVAGFVVNRFRGQESLLKDALDYTLAHTGRPVLGVIPYLPDLDLPEEDSVSFKCGAMDRKPARERVVDLAVVDLPHISNFTDVDPFRGEPDVQVRIVRSAAELGEPDAVIIPGSKHTLGDLACLKASGLADGIVRLARTGKTEVVGLCAGFQMMGREVRDPGHVESDTGSAAGLGLLDIDTVLNAGKTLLRSTARHVPSGLMVRGYEIHHGRTESANLIPCLVRDDQEPVGVGDAGGRIWGTYLHGVFDSDPFRRWFIDRLRVRRGLAPVGDVRFVYDIEPALDRLACTVREHLDMGAVHRLLGIR